ncbi:TRAP transporter small permease subunit [Shewanella sp. GXUN23E]|uniref:TRAP transporter small permease subunit n=1 Tax=Shewanella sp. GXUN23E TaxID=3422498 RepID=UPI003D7DE6A5
MKPQDKITPELTLSRPVRLWLERLYLAGALLAALAIVLICLLILARVVGRWFGVIVPAADDLSGYLLAASAMLPLAYTLRRGSHIRVTLIAARVTGALRHWLQQGVLLLALPLAGYLSWHLAFMVWQSAQFHEMSTGYLAFPIYWVQWPLPLGMSLFTLSLLDTLLTGTGAALAESDDALTQSDEALTPSDPQTENGQPIRGEHE